jgi:hypothetical protein
MADRKQHSRQPPKTSKPTKNDGSAYEAIVAKVHRDFGDDSRILEDETIIGKSGIPRQCDVTIRKMVCGYEVLIIIECKDYSRRVDMPKVDAFEGFLDDVGGHKGILISDTGFTEGALARAKRTRRIDLCSVFDATNEGLKYRVTIPTIAEHLGLKWFTAFKQRGEELLQPDANLMSEARAVFAEHWNADPRNRQPGWHAWNVLVSEFTKIEFLYKWFVVSTLRFKEVPLTAGSGTYSYIEDRVRTQGVTTTLDTMAILSWPVVNRNSLPPFACWVQYSDYIQIPGRPLQINFLISNRDPARVDDDV